MVSRQQGLIYQAGRQLEVTVLPGAVRPLCGYGASVSARLKLRREKSS